MLVPDPRFTVDLSAFLLSSRTPTNVIVPNQLKTKSLSYRVIYICYLPLGLGVVGFLNKAASVTILHAQKKFMSDGMPQK
jgi:hypothetical protein